MGIVDTELGDFREAVRILMREGRVVRADDDRVTLPDAAGKLTGSFRGHQRGFGFVVPESPTEHGDLFIPPGATMGAISGDTVLARITRRGKAGDPKRVEGQIIEILERGQSRFVGELVKNGKRWVMVPDGHALHAPVELGDARSTRARAGDQIVVELTEFPTDASPARGVIVEVLGRRGDPGVDTLSIIRQYHLRDTFPEEVLENARHVVREHDLKMELARRDDLRDYVIITIDPDEAKDFDDAISIRKLPGGHLELGVHIADVSTYVTPGSPLDLEAAQRGNSVYFPGHVLPMLPEVLSNGLCSLQEGEPRLTKSVFIEYDKKGKRCSRKYANTVIYSAKRLTYRQATAILEGQTQDVPRNVADLVHDMDALARIIRHRRLDDGMIVLEMPGVEFVLNDDNQVIGVEPEDMSFSHTIIEMFMVEANEAVAELFADMNVPHIRRIHAEPPGDSQQKLSRFLGVLGRTIPARLNRSDLIRLVDSTRGTPEAFAVHMAVLRSMSQAEYSPSEIGHYALASRHYSHFTSPIRRYPDLIVHRLLEMHLSGRLKTKGDRANAPSSAALAEIGRKCSFTERHAESAERELRKVMMLRHLESQIGKTQRGIVTDVTNTGVFVMLREYDIEGLLRFDDLPDDWWELNARGGCVIGQRSGKRIAVGDELEVVIAGVDIPARKLDLIVLPDAMAKLQRANDRKSTRRPAAPKTRQPRGSGKTAPKRPGHKGKIARKRRR